MGPDQSAASIFRAGWPESLSFPQAFDSSRMKSSRNGKKMDTVSL